MIKPFLLKTTLHNIISVCIYCEYSLTIVTMMPIIYYYIVADFYCVQGVLHISLPKECPEDTCALSPTVKKIEIT
jgi:hypothetical protein